MDDKSTYSVDSAGVFGQLARLSVAASTTCLIALAVASLHIMSDAERLRLDAVHHSAEYLTKTEVLWTQMVRMRDAIGGRQRASIQRFTRSYDPFKEIVQKCNGCVRLSCAPGPIGPIGEAGADGTPGTSGSQGAPGADGVDIILGPFPDLPCVVCPGGHPGPRGEVGERGWPGEPGGKGVGGPPGQPGTHGRPGQVGAPGAAGHDGQPGLPGAPGDSIVAGVGVKGPKGARGPAGFVGPVGIPGRPSNILGKTGPQGAVGPPGATGDIGLPGQLGVAGVPGEMGAIQPFCVSDCGASNSAHPPASAVVRAATSQQFAFPLVFAPSAGAGEDYETLDLLNDS